MDDEARARRRAVVSSLSQIAAHLRSFPAAFRPIDDDVLDRLDYSGQLSSDYRKAFDRILSNHLASWPREVISRFMSLSFLIANEAALAREDHPDIDGTYLLSKLQTDVELAMGYEAMMFNRGALGRMARTDPMLAAKFRFVARHLSTHYAPYENLIYTFLGPRAFEFFSLSSHAGRPNIQPHEASREEWLNLYKIDSQVRLERELTTLGALDPDRSKDMVGAVWGIAALMSHLSPSVFLGEGEPYVSTVG